MTTVLEKLFTFLLIIGLALFAFFGCSSLMKTLDPYNGIETSKNLPKYDANQDYNENGIIPVVRIHRDGKFICSGTVISNDYVLTAAHCVTKESFLNGYPKLDRSNLEIVSIASANNPSIKLVANAVAGNQRADYALIKGDFSKFAKMALNMSTTMMYSIQGPVTSCGFPWGATLTCYGSTRGGRYYSSFTSDSFMYPGMSGGPVIDMGTGVLFAVNTGSIPESSIISPIIGLFESLGVEVVH